LSNFLDYIYMNHLATLKADEGALAFD